MWIDFLKAILVGFCGSVPLGPIGVLCIQRTLAKGRASGLISGAGAAFADTIFSAIAILGLAVVQQLIKDNEASFLIGGGAILIFLGVNIFFTNPIKQLRKNRMKKGRFVEDFVSVFLLTLTNPATIFFLMGLFALMKLDLSGDTHQFSAFMVLLGVFVGASLWWVSLTSLVDRFRRKFRLKQLWMVNRISGIAIFIMGIISFLDGLWMLFFK